MCGVMFPVAFHLSHAYTAISVRVWAFLAIFVAGLRRIEENVIDLQLPLSADEDHL